MNHPYLTPEMLDILGGAERWRLISTLLPAEVAPVARRGGSVSHAHPHQEVMIPLAGRGLYAHGDHAYSCLGGTVFFFDRFEPHDDGYGKETRDAKHLWISIVEDRAFARILHVVDGRMMPGYFACAVQPEELGVDLQRAIADARRLSGNSAGLARARLLGAIAALVTLIVEDGSAGSARSSGSIQEQAIEAIKRHIQQTAGNGVTLEHLARIVGFSKFHFLRLFKRHTGRTVHQYVDECRLQRVEELLTMRLKYREIGERLGFSCPAAFSRWYKGRR